MDETEENKSHNLNIEERTDSLIARSTDVRIIKNIPYIIRNIINPISRIIGKQGTPEPDSGTLDKEIEIYITLKRGLILNHLLTGAKKTEVINKNPGDKPDWFNDIVLGCFTSPELTPEIYQFVLRSVYIFSQLPDLDAVFSLIPNDTLFYNYVLYIEFMLVIMDKILPDSGLFRNFEVKKFIHTLPVIKELLIINMNVIYCFQYQMINNFCLYYIAKKKSPHAGRGMTTIDHVIDNYKGFIEQYSSDNQEVVGSHIYYSLVGQLQNTENLEDPAYYFHRYRPADNLMGFAPEVMDKFSLKFSELQHLMKSSFRNLREDDKSRMKYLYDIIENTNEDLGDNKQQVLVWQQSNPKNAGYLLRTKTNYEFEIIVNRDFLGMSEQAKKMLVSGRNTPANKLFSVTYDKLNCNSTSPEEDQSIQVITKAAFAETAKAAREYIARKAGTTSAGIQVPDYRGQEENQKRSQIRTLLKENNYAVDQILKLRNSLMDTANSRIKYFNHSPIYKYNPLVKKYSTRDDEGKKQSISRRNSELTLIFTLYVYKRWFENGTHFHTNGGALQAFNNEIEQNRNLDFLKKGRQEGVFSSGYSSIYRVYTDYLKKIDKLSLQYNSEVSRNESHHQRNVETIHVAPAQKCQAYEKKNPVLRGLEQILNPNLSRQYKLNKLRKNRSSIIKRQPDQNMFDKMKSYFFDREEYKAAVRALDGENTRLVTNDIRERNDTRKFDKLIEKLATSHQHSLKSVRMAFKVYLDKRIEDTDSFANF